MKQGLHPLLWSFALPRRKSSSIRKLNPISVAPARAPTVRLLAAVPPVASTSSTISTPIPGPDGVVVHLQHIRAVLERILDAVPRRRQLPGLRMGTSPASSAIAIGAPSRKPRASIDTTRETPRPRNGAAMRSDGLPEQPGVEQQRRDVLEDDPAPREIRNIPDTSANHFENISPIVAGIYFI